jgi:hypothetical protein|tara:strand:+ start:262 stop:597 length:336 start_codon:yes stop_codon:yes gene_type:complete
MKKEMDSIMTLEKNKYYIVLSEMPDDKFHMVAYDTTGKKYETHEDHSVASIMHEGLLALLRKRGEEVFRCGEAEIEFNFVANEMAVDYLDETGERLDMFENVIRVDFGKEH